MTERAPIAIVGAGRAGCSVACALALAGASPWLIARNPRRFEEVQAWLAGLALPRPVLLLADVRRLARARTVVLAVPDRALAEVTADLTPHRRPGQVWLHLSGATPASVLDAEPRVPVASLHPLCALPDPVAARLDAEEAAAPLRGALLALDGEGEGLAVAREMAEALGGLALRVYPEARASYHAAAALVANDLVALLALGLDACTQAGLPQAALRQGLVHLAGTSLQAVARLGPDEPLARGLTGAVSRGDADTLARHLDALEPDARAAHILLSRRLVALVEGQGTLPPDRIAALRRVLGGS